MSKRVVTTRHHRIAAANCCLHPWKISKRHNDLAKLDRGSARSAGIAKAMADGADFARDASCRRVVEPIGIEPMT
jgi:hypothetical protein